MHLLTMSFGTDSISLSLQNSVIEIKRLPINKAYSNCYIKIANAEGYCEYESEIFETLPNCYRIPQKLKDGSHRLCICIKSPYGENAYYDIFGPQNGIPFRKQGKYIEFIPSPILDSNKSFLLNQKKRLHSGDLSYGLEPSHMIQSTNPEIKKLAENLTRNSVDTISQIKDIYYFVSRTLRYDQIARDNGSFSYTGQTAKEALKFGRCVCQGFANLTVAMCRAIGIPSYSVGVYTKPTPKQWEEVENKHNGNHQIAMAWANFPGRWVIMDPTWDSDQNYDANGYGNRHGNGLVYKYFDVTTEFISYTHRFEEILNI